VRLSHRRIPLETLLTPRSQGLGPNRLSNQGRLPTRDLLWAMLRQALRTSSLARTPGRFFISEIIGITSLPLKAGPSTFRFARSNPQGRCPASR
jgi:hypothetical protein